MAQETQPQNRRVISFTSRGNNKAVKYPVTEEDFLTLARAVEWEGPPQNIVAWTLLQRFAYLYPLYPTLDKFIKAYAQPINPRWFPDGVEHIKWRDKWKAAGKTAEYDAEMKEAPRRVTKAATPASKISQKTYNALKEVFSGVASPCPGSVHYRAPTVRTTDVAVAAKAREEFAKSRKLLDNVKLGDPRKENWFFGEPGVGSFSIQLIAQSSVLVLLGLVSALYIYYQIRG